MTGEQPRLPQARIADLLLRELPAGELIVYDTESHRAHTLNRSAALVWRLCDGQREASAVAARLQQELGLPAAEELVWQAVAQLQQARLVDAGAVLESVSRRALVKKLALAAGLAGLLPVITSIAAPTPAMAASGTSACLPARTLVPFNDCGPCCSKNCTQVIGNMSSCT